MSRAAHILLHVLMAGSTSAIACATASPHPEITATKETTKVPPAPSPSPSVSASASASASELPEQPHLVVAIYGAPILAFERVRFDVGSSKVGKEHDELFKAIAELLTAQPAWYLAIEARTETSEGKDASARNALAKKRGDAIVAKLVALGLDAKRLRVRLLGDTKPVTAGKTDEERALNRSATFRLELEDGSPP